MKLSSRLALSQLKINKRRTSWTLLGITLSTAMLSTIYGLGFGTGLDWFDRITQQSSAQIGYYTLITGLAMIMSVFVLVISVIVISNAFRVSANERLTQFGILKSVGATKAQIMQSVIYEGLYLTIIGIPLGIMIAIGVQFISIGLINDVIEPMFSHEDLANGNHMMTFVWSWFAFILAISVSLLTVFFSAWIPARKASIVPAINAIRGVGEVQIEKKKVRGGAVVKKLFGVEGMLARTFLKRSKRNFRATVIAMSFSIAIFIVAGGFYDQMSRYAEIAWGSVDANVRFSSYVQRSKEVDCDEEDEWVENGWSQEIEDENGEWIIQCYVELNVREVAKTVDEFNAAHTSLEEILNEGDRLIGIGYEQSYHTNLHISRLTPVFREAYEEWSGGDNEEYKQLGIRLIVVDDAFASELAELAGVDVGSNILLNQSRYWFKDGRVMDSEILDFTYQTLSLSQWRGEGVEDLAHIELELELHGQLTADQIPVEIGINGGFSVDVIVPEANLLLISWVVQTEDSAGITARGAEFLLDYFDEGTVWIDSFDLDAAEAMDRNTIGLVMTFVFVFVGTLILIGLTNVISTIAENVRTRSGEFAVLQSVGMTSGGVKRMLNLETVFSSLQALIIGVPLGILGNYGSYLSMSNMSFTEFSIPWAWIISAVLAIFLVTWITMRYAANRLKGRNIIEAIRSGSGI